MDSAIRSMKGRQQMKQLYLRKRIMLMVASICRLFERMGMDNRYAMFDMNVNKHRNTAVIPDEEYRQQPFHIFNHNLFHVPFVFESAKVR